MKTEKIIELCITIGGFNPTTSKRIDDILLNKSKEYEELDKRDKKYLSKMIKKLYKDEETFNKIKNKINEEKYKEIKFEAITC